ncbi:transposase [Autumnicola psychrophila]|uniref:Transposase n=1 Tax=Autumnicola psychrophila TaxID=3075592 RepID=A0ABU3DPS0_9FLAO|nr:transposase [Zunongwangia sp. F225]MDT0685077.1 transposase [Zunongwangia sp. F225]
MTDKFRNKYRIPSARLQTWDYSWNAAYFVTICTHNRQNFFGKISDAKMQLSEIGTISHQFWNEIPNHFPFIQLGEFIAMPNHIHGIIIINNPPHSPGKSNDAGEINNPAAPYSPDNVQTPNLGVSSGIPERANPENRDNDAANNPLKKQKSGGKNEQWKPGTLGVIINQYKRICTIHARKINPNFAWQTRFHDIIIRDERAFDAISEYIKNNPAKWAADQFHQQNKT